MSKENSIFRNFRILQQYTILTASDIERITASKEPLDQAFAALTQEVVDSTVGEAESKTIEFLASRVANLLERGFETRSFAYRPRGVEFVHNSLVTPVTELPGNLEALGYRLIVAQSSQEGRDRIVEKMKTVLEVARNVVSVIGARQEKQWQTAYIIEKRKSDEMQKEQGGAEPGL